MTTSTSFTWAIANLERETSDGYVFTAHYTVSAKNDTYSAGAYGSLGFDRPEGELTPFSDLPSSKLLVQWIFDALGEEKVIEENAALQNQLDEQAAPTKAAGLPWVNG
jgi:hypothetical protein